MEIHSSLQFRSILAALMVSSSAASFGNAFLLLPPTKGQPSFSSAGCVATCFVLLLHPTAASENPQLQFLIHGKQRSACHYLTSQSTAHSSRIPSASSSSQDQPSSLLIQQERYRCDEHCIAAGNHPMKRLAKFDKSMQTGWSLRLDALHPPTPAAQL